jgi:hypothetical protein
VIVLCSLWTDVSEEHVTSIFRVENQPCKKTRCSRWLGRMAAALWFLARLIFNPEAGGDTFLWNISSHMIYMVLYLRRWEIHNYPCENVAVPSGRYSTQTWFTVSTTGIRTLTITAENSCSSRLDVCGSAIWQQEDEFIICWFGLFTCNDPPKNTSFQRLDPAFYHRQRMLQKSSFVGRILVGNTLYCSLTVVQL